MELGICGGPDTTQAAAEAGLDFFEWTVGEYLKPRETDEAFAESVAAARRAALPCPVVNCFVPGDLKITGPDVDPRALEQYVTAACERAQEAGVQVIVFGSGGARRIPDDFDRAEAGEQLVAFGRMLGPVAGAHEVTIAVEPLSRNDCNVLTTVGESADYVRAVDHPAVRLLVDSFHWARDDDSLQAIVDSGHLLAHVHVATVPSRLPPGCEPCDLGPFFEAIKAGGYDGRVSIEAKVTDPSEDLPRAVETMRSLAGA